MAGLSCDGPKAHLRRRGTSLPFRFFFWVARQQGPGVAPAFPEDGDPGSVLAGERAEPTVAGG
jgi:hypothetical protein